MKKIISYDLNKFSKLNFNLKNEIFNFLPFNDLINVIYRIDKKTLLAINFRKSINIIKLNFSNLLQNLEFKLDKLLEIKKDYFILEEITEVAFEQIITHLFKIKFKEEIILDLSSSEIGLDHDFLIKIISQIIEENKTIIKLYLDNNLLGMDFEGKSIKSLSEGLYKNFTLQELYLNENCLGDKIENMKYLSEALKCNKTIKALVLFSNNLGLNSKNIFYLSELIKMNDTIQFLDISLNELGYDPKNFSFLSDALKINQSLKELYLTNNNIGCNIINIKILSEAFETNLSLIEINLNSNQLGMQFENMSILIKSLKINSEKFHKIRTIFLRCNEIENDFKIKKFIEEELENNSFIIINF